MSTVEDQLAALREQTKGGREVRVNAVEIALWQNSQRRTGVNPRTQEEFNDSHMNGRVRIDPNAKLRMPGDTQASGNTGPSLLEAMQIAAKNNATMELFFDTWFGDGKPGANGGARPEISGHGNTLVVPKEAAATGTAG